MRTVISNKYPSEMKGLFFLLEIWLQNEMSPLEYFSLIKKKLNISLLTLRHSDWHMFK